MAKPKLAKRKNAEEVAREKASEDDAQKAAKKDDDDAKEAEAEDAEAVKERQEQEKKKKRKLAQTEYEKLLRKVAELKEMTDTPKWREVYASIHKAIARHGEEVLDAEKSRDVIHHQEGVKILRGLVDRVKAPVTALEDLCSKMPLFVKEFKTRATWNEKIGAVEMTTRKK